MTLEAIRMIADWWADATNGINANIAGLTLEGTDSVPDLVNVLDTTRDRNTEDEEAPPDWPVVIVSADEPSEMAELFSQGAMDGFVTVTGRYITKGEEKAELRMQALYTLRAMYQSLHELMEPGNQADRNRNGVQIRNIDEFAWSDLTVPIQDGFTVAGALAMRLNMRDLTE